MKKRIVFVAAALVLSLPGFAKEYEQDTAGPAQPAVLLAAAAPQALQATFDDSGFSYYGKDEGFIQLSSDVSGLILHLEGTADPNGVKYAFEEVAELSRKEHDRIYQKADRHESFMEQRRVQAEEGERLRRLINVTQRRNELTVIHQRASLNPVLDFYLEAFNGVGLEVRPELEARHTRVYTVSDGARQARVTFTRQGSNIRVRIAGFSS